MTNHSLLAFLSMKMESSIPFSYRLEDKGKIESIKFSPDLRVLAIQRSQSTVEFINFIEGIDVLEYSQACKV